LSGFRLIKSTASQFSNNRCFIAGDAAHIHTPAGGQGMNTGIQDAYNLAWKISGVLKSQLKKEILDSYNTERGQNAKNLLRTTDQMFEVMAGTNRFLNFLRLHVFPPILGMVTKSSLVRKMIFTLISQTGINYSGSELTVKSSVGKVKAGLRMPYFKFSDQREINDYITDPSFKLIYFGDKQNGITNPGNSKIEVKHLSFKEIPRQLFGTATDFYLLLRPDNHIVYAGKDFIPCEKLLSRISA
jgi:hypothetical protein